MTSFGISSQPVSRLPRSQEEGGQDINNKLLEPNRDQGDSTDVVAEAAGPSSIGFGANKDLSDSISRQYAQSSSDSKIFPNATTTSTKNIHPFISRVHWFQDDVSLTFDIHIYQIKDWHVDINETSDSFNFFAQSGEKFGNTNKYQFSLELYAKVLDNPVCLPNRNKFRLVFYKQPSCFGKWPRLTRDTPSDNLIWLKERQDGGACEDTEEQVSTDENDEILDNSPNQQEEISSLIGRVTDEYDYDDGNDDFIVNSKYQQSDSISESSDTDERLHRFLEDQEQYLYDRIHNEHQVDANLTTCKRAKRASTKIEFKSSDPVDIFNPFKRRELTKSIASNKMGRTSESTSGSIRNKNLARNALSLKSTYLFLYNLTMFVMFLMVNLILVIKTVSNKLDDDTVNGAAFLIKILTFTQLLESVHPMLGLVPGGPLMPLLQAFGRLVVNHFLSEPEIRNNAAPYASHLFIVWSSIEIFRYSYYTLRVFNLELYPLTWCRYTLFMPLYPLGGLCESMVILSAIDYYTLTGDYSVALPNAANFSFNLPIFLKIYVFLLLGPSIMHLMNYMLSQRRKQLKPKTT